MTLDLTALLEKLRRLKWDWRMAEAERIVGSLAGQPTERVPGRTTYRVDGLENISLYHEGDQAEYLEITIESFKDPHLLSSVEYEEKVDEYFEKHKAAVREATVILGRPEFNDGCAAPGFPNDQEAVWLALWHGGNARLMIQQKHEDKELPLRLCIVMAPTATPS